MKKKRRTGEEKKRRAAAMTHISLIFRAHRFYDEVSTEALEKIVKILKEDLE